MIFLFYVYTSLFLYLSHLYLQTNENVPYIKVVCAKKRVLAEILEDIIDDPSFTAKEKGMARRFLNDLEHKSDDEAHCFWYVGETARSLLERMKEKYPEILERMGVTHRLQVGQAGESILDWPSKDQVLLLEAVVAFMIEGSINKTLQIAAEEKSEQFLPLPLHNIGSANTISCGNVNGASKPGIGLFCRRNCSTNNRFMKVSEVTSDTNILNYVDQFLYPIALANGYEPNDSYEPTMIELCIAMGTFSKESGKGLWNKSKLPIAETDYYVGDELVTKAGNQYPDWGSYSHHMGMGVYLFMKLNRLAVVAEETCPDISELRSFKRITFEGEDKDIYDALSKEFGVRVLLQKVKESRQKHNGRTVKVNLDVTSGVDPGFGIYFNPKKGDQYIKFQKVVPQSIAGQCRHINNGKRIKRINGKGYGRCYDTAKVLLQEAYRSGNITLEIFTFYD